MVISIASDQDRYISNIYLNGISFTELCIIAAYADVIVVLITYYVIHSQL